MGEDQHHQTGQDPDLNKKAEELIPNCTCNGAICLIFLMPQLPCHNELLYPQTESLHKPFIPFILIGILCCPRTAVMGALSAFISFSTYYNPMREILALPLFKVRHKKVSYQFHTEFVNKRLLQVCLRPTSTHKYSHNVTLPFQMEVS